MRYLLLDIGNTRIKQTLAVDNQFQEWDGAPVDMALASITGEMPDLKKLYPNQEISILTHETPLPIAIDYHTPQTLGADRRAAACGAWYLAHGEDVLIIDAGTCITIDFVDSKKGYQGGAILPGIEMKFKALHTFTARLPLIEKCSNHHVACGKSTEESILSGVMVATRYEVQGYIAHYKESHPNLKVFLTGGDANCLELENVILEPNLVLIGLKEICKLIYEK